jgi:hypothetical protein
MSATVIQLRPGTVAPEQISVADELRRIADQIETGAVISASIIVTDRKGNVSTVNAPVLASGIGGLRR